MTNALGSLHSRRFQRGHLAASLVFCATVGVSAASYAEESTAGPDPVAQLTDGNGRFTSGKATHPNQLEERRDQTKDGQHPFVTVLSCSDSRVPPEILFDQGLGDVFAVRVAGNVADTDELGSVEYGVDHLGTPLLVVLGHTKCGAVTAVATKAEVHGHIPELVDNIIPAVELTKTKFPNLNDKELVPEAIKANVFQSIKDLVSKSAAIHDRLKEGKVKIVGAVYDIASGKVEWLGEHPEQAALLAAAPPAEHGAGSDKPGEDEHKKPAEGAGHGKPGESAEKITLVMPDMSVGFALTAFLCVLFGGLSGFWAASRAKKPDATEEHAKA